MCKPVFTAELKDLAIRDGESLTLTCSVRGDPDPQIVWSKNGKSLSSSEILDLKYKNGTATLTINEIFPEDEGVYVCTATNSIGSVDTTCKLTVIRKLYLKTKKKEKQLGLLQNVNCSLQQWTMVLPVVRYPVINHHEL